MNQSNEEQLAQLAADVAAIKDRMEDLEEDCNVREYFAEELAEIRCELQEVQELNVIALKLDIEELRNTIEELQATDILTKCNEVRDLWAVSKGAVVAMKELTAKLKAGVE